MTRRLIGTIAAAVILCSTMLFGTPALSGPGDQDTASMRQLEPVHPKAFLYVFGKSLELLWNGDMGESARGRGEVFVHTTTMWLTDNRELPDPQFVAVGPFGGDGEFPSSTIAETPAGSGNYQLVPAEVPFPSGSNRLYFNKADCPVGLVLRMHIVVWEEDTDLLLSLVRSVIKSAVLTAADNASGVLSIPTVEDIANAVLDAILDLFLGGQDNEVLSDITVFIPIPDPCIAPFDFEHTIALPTSSAVAEMWKNGIPSSEDGIGLTSPPHAFPVPINIGKLKVKLIGYLGDDKWSSYHHNLKAGTSQELRGCDLGQADSATLTGSLELGASIPASPSPVTYSFMLDIDNHLGTGSWLPLKQGAEFEMRSVMLGGPVEPIYQLLKWNAASGAFEPFGSLHSGSLDPTRAGMQFTVALDQIGNPPGPIAGWGLVSVGGVPIAALPENPAALGVGVMPSHISTSDAPNVAIDPQAGSLDVPVTAAFQLTFSESMDLAATEAGVLMLPPVPLARTWHGNTLTVQPLVPLQPGKSYSVVVGPPARDVGGQSIDGDGNGIGGDSFVAHFKTEWNSHHSTDAAGIPKGRFAAGEQAYVSFSTDPPLMASFLYLNRHKGSLPTTGGALMDMTSDGPNVVQSFGGPVPPISLGTILESGEFNLILDVDSDGLFTPGVDRADRWGIGLHRPFACPADLNGDGGVDGADLGMLLAEWGRAGSADFNGSGTVEGADLGVLLAAWGSCN